MGHLTAAMFRGSLHLFNSHERVSPAEDTLVPQDIFDPRLFVILLSIERVRLLLEFLQFSVAKSKTN